MSFPSIIHAHGDAAPAAAASAPSYFRDLNLDQIVAAITRDKEEYDLAPVFYQPLQDIDTIRYRHEVWRDLESRNLPDAIRSFATSMHSIRVNITQINKLYYQLQKEGWFLDEAEAYGKTIIALAGELEKTDLKSRGFRAFRQYLSDYAASHSFNTLVSETKILKERLATVKYSVVIYDDSFTVRPYEEETNYSTDVVRTFEKFKQGSVRSYASKFSDSLGMNHIEAKVLEFVARLYPEIFRDLAAYVARHANFVDEAVLAFDREIQFYVAYQDYMSEFTRTGLSFCYPVLSHENKTERSEENFDLALAKKLIADKSAIVTNGYELFGEERIIVVSGPNQGGKTTFARTFGQLHYLASLGCPIPGTVGQLFLFDRLFTHFEKEEDIKNLRGKLEDDLVRINGILDHATSNSIVIMNEIFTSTTLNDAIFLGKEILQRIADRDALCVCVTFIDELASLNEKTISMVSTIVPEDPAKRTFKVVRRPADGLSYAISIAEKYRLTYKSLKGRIPA